MFGAATAIRNREACVFLLRSIRRRLFTGFTIALSLLLIMSAAAIWGLVRHQQAVGQLNDVVHNSPNSAGLKSALFAILLPLETDFNLRQDAALTSMKVALQKQIRNAQTEANTFSHRSLMAAEDPAFQSLYASRRASVQTVTAMNLVQKELTALSEVCDNLDLTSLNDPDSRLQAKTEIQIRVTRSISRMNHLVSALPDHNQQTHVEASLKTEVQRSWWALMIVGGLTVFALIVYAVTIYCGFRWVSDPLRVAAQGAARIANGDTKFRLVCLSRWKDEFFELASNFNRMADRFEEAQEHLNAKVEERSRQLVRSERLAGVGFLAAGVAHEVNNPLQAMGMAAESVQMRVYDHFDPDHDDTAEVIERLQMIQRESKQCGEITRQLLNFARNESEEKRNDDLTRVVGEVLAMIRPMSRYNDRRIIFERTSPVFAEINASQMKQVVTNLVSNALQATDSEGTVEIDLQERTDSVVLTVRDNGHGMDATRLENLFEPFYTTKEVGEGTGLGLSITHRLVEEHHGTIDPHSAGPGKGSTFRVRLPRRQPVEKEKAA